MMACTVAGQRYVADTYEPRRAGALPMLSILNTKLLRHLLSVHGVVWLVSPHFQLRGTSNGAGAGWTTVHLWTADQNSATMLFVG